MSDENQPLVEAPKEAPKAAPKAPKKGREKVAKIDLDKLAKVAPEDAAFETRKALVKMPEGLSDAEAVEWSDKALKKLAPEAVARIAYNLRFGTERESLDAADKVLRSVGLDKREATSAPSQALIVLNLGSNMEAQPQWLQRVQKPNKRDE